MNADEAVAAKKISRIMRASRKKLGISQRVMCRQIGTSQGTLSKIENAEVIPSAYQWVEFCRITGISPNSYYWGYIDTARFPSSPTLREGTREGQFSIPESYSFHRGEMIRSLRVPLLFLESKLGAQKCEQWLSTRDIDPDYFVDLSNQLNLNFFYDVFEYLIQNSLLSPGDLDELVKPANQPHMHGNLRKVYDTAHRSEHLLKAFVSNSRAYDVDFDYQIESESPSSHLEISVRPHSHVSDFKTRDGLGDVLCRYRRKFLEQFSSYLGSPPARILQSQCLHQGADRCLYRVPLA